MNSDSFESLYKNFYLKIRRYLDRLVGPDSAADLTQEVFLRAYKNFESFEGRSSISTWLYRIASNAATDLYRNASERNRRSESSIFTEDERIWISSLLSQNAGSSIDEEMLECVREFVDSLPENYRTAFVLHELEGYSNVEVAEILNVTIPTAKIRIHRGKVRLKKKMENGCCLYYDEENRIACSRKNNSTI